MIYSSSRNLSDKNPRSESWKVTGPDVWYGMHLISNNSKLSQNLSDMRIIENSGCNEKEGNEFIPGSLVESRETLLYTST